MARDKASQRITATITKEDKQFVDKKAEEVGGLSPNRSEVIRRAIDALREREQNREEADA